MATPHQLWTLILAAGAGRRLAGVTGGVPKQFWRRGSAPSLLRQTIDRFLPLTPRSRTVIVVNAAHLRHVPTSDIGEAVSSLRIQPDDRGTAAGVLLGLANVVEHSPDSIVVVTPSDHGVVDDAKLRNSVLEAAREVRAGQDIILFGIEPTRAQIDYGWISLGGSAAAGGLRPVASFTEKPPPEVAARLLGSGAVWNTMVTVSRARTMWDLCLRQLPEIAHVFARAIEQPVEERAAFLTSAYCTMPARDFSRDVLTHTRGLSAYVWPATIGWSDLGTPERLREWERTVTSRGSLAGNSSAA